MRRNKDGAHRLQCRLPSIGTAGSVDCDTAAGLPMHNMLPEIKMAASYILYTRGKRQYAWALGLDALDAKPKPVPGI